jgi:hypothetical protein
LCYLREPDWKPFSPMAVFHFCPGAWPSVASGTIDEAADVTAVPARTFNAMRRSIEGVTHYAEVVIMRRLGPGA